MSEKFMAGAAVQPRQDMPEPYILWDTRSWDGSLGVGTGGIPNEGTAGSSFDLDVTQRDVGYWGYFAKQGPAAESAPMDRIAAAANSLLAATPLPIASSAPASRGPPMAKCVPIYGRALAPRSSGSKALCQQSARRQLA